MLAVADPATGGQRLEQAPIEPAWRTQVGVLDHRVLSQAGQAQSSTEPLVVARGHLAIDQQTEPVLTRQIVARRLLAHVDKRVGHRAQAKAAQALQLGMAQYRLSLQW